MSTEVQTRTAHCPTHGRVEAIRELPRIRFPFVYHALRRALAQRRPFRCPTCREPVAG